MPFNVCFATHNFFGNLKGIVIAHEMNSLLKNWNTLLVYAYVSQHRLFMSEVIYSRISRFYESSFLILKLRNVSSPFFKYFFNFVLQSIKKSQIISTQIKLWCNLKLTVYNGFSYDHIFKWIPYHFCRCLVDRDWEFRKDTTQTF